MEGGRARTEAAGGPEDAEIVARVVDGDSEAFGTIVTRYKDRLYNTVYRFVGSAEDARDLVQDTFVRAFEHLETFRGSSSLYTWLFRIAVNASLSHRRRKRGVPLRAAAGTDASPVAWVDPSAPDPADPLVAAETETLVQQALGQLDEDHRAIVVLRDIQHLDYREIAEILGIPTGTVKSRLHRARFVLRARLRPLLKA